jgi:alpha-mannosidase
MLLAFLCSDLLVSKSRGESINNNNIINVHIVPHTHDDAGWLWTLEEYYTGDNSWGKCVKCILDNMVISLNADKSRTFTYVEMAFFEKWYSQLDESTKANVKNLIKEGRLDFANGGWVMNDEATVHYQHVIDQMRIGMHFLKKEFDYTPRIAWYLDPFGHSLTNAYLLNKLGFDKLVMVRIDFREKEKRIKEKSMEFIWRPYFEIDGGQSKILTHITHGHYSPDDKVFPNLLETNYNNHRK